MMKPNIIKSYTSFSFGPGSWATSDLHFLHTNGARYRGMTLDEMHDRIFEGNKVVGVNDTLYIIGDLSLANEKQNSEIAKLIRALKGRKILITGNHDKTISQEIVDCFEHVTPYLEATVSKAHTSNKRNNLCVMSHYPIVSWNRMSHGSWHLYGHCHGNLKIDLGRAQDVGLECNDFKPFSFEQIKSIMEKKSSFVVDHHQSLHHKQKDALINTLYEKIDALERMLKCKTN